MRLKPLQLDVMLRSYVQVMLVFMQWVPWFLNCLTVAQMMAEQRRMVDHMAKMMAFETLRDLMQRPNRIGNSSDSNW